MTVVAVHQLTEDGVAVAKTMALDPYHNPTP